MNTARIVVSTVAFGIGGIAASLAHRFDSHETPKDTDSRNGSPARRSRGDVGARGDTTGGRGKSRSMMRYRTSHRLASQN